MLGTAEAEQSPCPASAQRVAESATEVDGCSSPICSALAGTTAACTLAAHPNIHPQSDLVL